MYLFDTMIVSYIFRHDPLVERYREEIEFSGPIFISCQTVAEIRYGAEQNGWGAAKVARIAKLFAEFTVLGMDVTTANHYAKIRAGAERLGQQLSSQDTWIMATAQQYGLTLVNHDADMRVGKDLGIKVLCRS